MGVHIKILGWFFLIYAMLMGLMVLVGHYGFYMSLQDTSSSVFAGQFSYSDRYFEFFENYGISPLQLLATFWHIISGFAFGYGILYYKEWARLLGLVIASVELLITLGQFFNYAFAMTDLIVVALVIYMFWVLLSKDVSGKCRKVAN